MSDSVNGDVTVTDPSTTNVVDPSVTAAGAPADEMVSKKELDRVVQESIKRKQELADAKKALEDERKRTENFKTQGMKDKEMWKEVAEMNEKKAQELETKYSGLQTAVTANAKFQALTTELHKLGVVPEAVEDLSHEWIDMLEVETTSRGGHSVINAKQVADMIKAKKPYMFGRPQNPNVNTTTPGVNGAGGQLTVTKVLELQKQYEKTKSEADRTAYHDAMRAYSKLNSQH